MKPKLLMSFLLINGAMISAVRGSEGDDELGNLSLESLLNMEVVSATRSKSKLSESPVPISVITAKEIEASGLTNIPDILSRLPEIEVLHISKSQIEVSIRGKGTNFSRRLLVLIDGRTVYNDLFGTTFWQALPISVGDVERIEVVRGPASALFGANAFAGVINIISKQSNTDGPSIAIRGEDGSHGTQYVQGKLHFKGQQWSGQFGGARQKAQNDSDEVEFQGFNRIPTIDVINQSKDSVDMNKANGEVAFNPSDAWEFKLNVDQSDGDLDLLFQPGLPRTQWHMEMGDGHFATNWKIDDGSSMQFNYYHTQLEYDTDLVPSQAVVDAFPVTDGRHFFPNAAVLYIPGSAEDPHKSGDIKTDDAYVQYVSSNFDGKLNWVAGLESRKSKASGGLVDDLNRSIHSWFGNFTLGMGDSKWLLAAGYRNDKDSITGSDFGYTSSISWFASESNSFRISSRRAFRAPDMFELNANIHLQVHNQFEQVIFSGNSALNDEVIKSTDFTWTWNISHQIQFVGEYFYESYKGLIGNPDTGRLDHIQFDPVTNTFITTTSFENLADATERGVDVSLRWVPSDSLVMYANYARTKPDGLNNLSGETFYSPHNKFNFGIHWIPASGIEFNLDDHWVGKTDPGEFTDGNIAPQGTNFTRENQEAYSTLSAKFGWHPGFIKGMELYIAGDNLLNKEHVEYYEFDPVLNAVGEKMGRTVWGGISWKF